MRDKEGGVGGYLAVTVSGNAFDLLGVHPYRGRLIATYDDVRGGPQSGWPAVLSYGFWNEFYSRDPNIIGKQIKTIRCFSSSDRYCRLVVSRCV